MGSIPAFLFFVDSLTGIDACGSRRFLGSPPPSHQIGEEE